MADDLSLKSRQHTKNYLGIISQFQVGLRCLEYNLTGLNIINSQHKKNILYYTIGDLWVSRIDHSPIRSLLNKLTAHHKQPPQVVLRIQFMRCL